MRPSGLGLRPPHDADHRLRASLLHAPLARRRCGQGPLADIAKLFAIANSARSLVMVVEAWAKLPDASGHLDTSTPPSESPDRREIVALMLEDHTRFATSMLPILRDASGVFADFGDPGPLQFGESAGRFAGLMPHNKPSAREAAQAQAILTQLGFNIENRGFDPSLN